MRQERELIDFRGQSYPARCSYCRAPIEGGAIILLNVTNLIFCDEDCVTGFIGSRAANITVGKEGRIQCMLS